MNGGDGDDTQVWNPGDDDDTMNGEAGNDTTEVNGGNVDEETTVKPSATQAGCSSTALTPTRPARSTLDIGTTENLVVNANGGNDTIKGSKGLAELNEAPSTVDGNDRIKGTDGKDVLSGGKANDLIRSPRPGLRRREVRRRLPDLAFVDPQRPRQWMRDRAGRAAAGRKGPGEVGQRDRQRRGAEAQVRRHRSLRGPRGPAQGRQVARRQVVRDEARQDEDGSIKLKKRGRKMLAKASGSRLKVQLRIDAEDQGQRLAHDEPDCSRARAGTVV